MSSARLRSLPGLVLAGLFFGIRLFAQDASSPAPSPPGPTAWQIAGIRTAFGDSRQPYLEPSDAVQREALKLCARLGWGAALDAQEAAAYLGSKDKTVQIAALQVLGQMGRDAVPHTRKIEALTTAKDRDVCAAAMKSLREIDPASPYGQSLIRSGGSHFGFGRRLVGDILAKVATATALGKTDAPEAPFFNEIAALLTNGNPSTQQSAGQALDLMQQNSAGAADHLAALLYDQNNGVQCAAATALGGMGREGAAFAPKIASLLHDSDSGVRVAALNALGHLGPEGAAFGKEILALLPTADNSFREAAGDALGEMGKVQGDLAAEIAAFIDKDDGSVRGVRGPAARALGRMGEAGTPFAGEVATVLNDRSSAARASAATALGQMGSDGAPYAKEVAALLKDAIYDVRASAAVALGEMGQDGAAFAPEIALLLQDRYGSTRRLALGALVRLGEERTFAAEIAVLLTDSDELVRSAARNVIDKLGADLAPFAKSTIADLLKNIDPTLHDDAGALLLRMAKAGTAKIATVAELLADPDDKVRNGAASTLDQLGNPEGDLGLQATMLASAHTAPTAELPALRAHLRLWAGGDPALQRTVTWLARPDGEPMPKEGLPAAETRETLGVFLRLWDQTAAYAALRQELAGRIGQVAKAISEPLDAETLKILAELATKLSRQGYDTAALQSALHR